MPPRPAASVKRTRINPASKARKRSSSATNRRKQAFGPTDFNKRLKMDGLAFLRKLEPEFATVAFFDPQYRGMLDKLKYGNEGKSRGQARAKLQQMSEEQINDFIIEIDRVLKPSGHLFLWMDKFHLCSGFTAWFKGTNLRAVDMVTWDKGRIGMGYRTRRVGEYVVVLQKKPSRAKGMWKKSVITDVVAEKIEHKDHAHCKPIGLQKDLIEAVSDNGDIVIDPAAGSFSVLKCCKLAKRKFLGCDING